MKKIMLSSIKKVLSENEMKHVTGGSGGCPVNWCETGDPCGPSGLGWCRYIGGGHCECLYQPQK